MSKIKVYDPKREAEKDQAREKLSIILEIVIDLLLYSVVLIIASNIFKGFYIENFAYAFLASAIIAGLNATIKPILVYFTMPLTVLTLGLFYPIVNVVVLKLCGLLLGSHFDVEGILSPFFMVLFISLMKMILDRAILSRVKGGK